MLKDIKKSFIKGASFAAGGLVFVALSYVVAQSMTTFSKGDLVTSSAINQNFQIAAPSGFIGAFYLSACPTGWVAADGTNSTPDLRGRFIRGLDDMGGGAGAASRDPDGTRALGNAQDDAFQNHWHLASSHILVGHETSTTANSGFALGAQYINVGALADASDTHTTNAISNPITDGATTPRTATETRPANIALIICMRQ